jgi:hypothetical protein
MYLKIQILHKQAERVGVSGRQRVVIHDLSLFAVPNVGAAGAYTRRYFPLVACEPNIETVSGLLVMLKSADVTTSGPSKSHTSGLAMNPV